MEKMQQDGDNWKKEGGLIKGRIARGSKGGLSVRETIRLQARCPL